MMTTSNKRPRRPTTKTAKDSGAPTVTTAAAGGENGTSVRSSPGTPAGASPGGGSRRRSRPAVAAGSPSPPEGASIKAVKVTVTSRHQEDRHAAIAKAAYLRSLSRGFAPGHEVEDWLAAEAEVDQLLLGGGRLS